MGAMFAKFKGHQVSKSKAFSDERAPLTKAKLEASIAQKRARAKAKEGHTGERGGPEGPEPTRYGDWEVGGKVSDF